MDEIKVGEYVRSLVNGRISKVLEISDLLEEPNVKYYKTGKFTGFCSTELDGTKHSPNIIDLIEVGDYVNGEKVTNIDNYNSIYTIEWEHGDVYTTKIINDKFIESIVTREQFERSAYKVNKNG